MIELLARFLCKHLHGAPYLPFKGRYECKRCGRLYDVPWLQQPSPPVPLGEEVRTEWESLSVNSRI